MGTIAQFVIELTADPTGVKTGLDRGVGYLNQFARTADQTFKGVGTTTQGYTAAESIVRGIETKFRDSSDRLREMLFRGVFSPEKFKAESGVLAQAMNTSLLGALEGFRSKGFDTPAFTQLFVDALSDAGLKSGQAFADRFQERLSALGEAAGRLGKILTAAVSVPIAGGAGLGLKEAIEGESDLARLNAAFGASAGEVARQLDALHERYPAQRKGLEEMASSTAFLLRSIDIVGPTAQRMSLGLAEAAGKLGLLRSADPAEVLDKLQAALRGNVRGLGEFGIAIKATSIQHEAERLGLVHKGQAIDETRRALASYVLVMQGVNKVVGDSSKFNDLASNQLRFLKRDAIEAAEAFGRTLLPAFTTAVRALDGFAKTVAALPAPVLSMLAVLAGLAAVVGPLLVAFAAFVKVLSFLRAAFAAAGTIEFLSGLTSLSAFVASGGVLLVGLGLVLAAVLAIRHAMGGADEDVAKFEASLGGLSKGQIGTIRADLGAQLEAAYKRRAEITSRATAATSGGFGPGSGGGTAAALSAINDQISVLEQKSAAAGNAVAALGANLAVVTDKPLPALPVDQFKELQSNVAATIDSLRLIEERYTLITRNVDSAVTLQGFINAQLTDQAATVDRLRGYYGEIDRLVRSGTLSAKERATAMRTELDIAKAIAAATDQGPAQRGALQFATQKLGALAGGPDTAALERAFREATQAADAFASLLDKGTLPATAANLSALETLRQSITKTATALDALDEFRSPGTPRTSGERNRLAGRDTFQASIASAANNAAFQSGETNAVFSNIGLGFKRELDNAKASVLAFARNFEPATLVFGALHAAVSGVLGVFKSVVEAVNPFSAIVQGLSNAAAPLAPVMTQIAAVVSQTLGPVFKALAPVVNALIPLIRAVFQVLSPILQALAPLFGALVPILNALFPVFKLVAIVATYLGQAVGTVAGVLLKIMGTFAVTIGGIIAGLGTLISHIPFLGGIGRDIRDFGNGIKNFGHGLNDASDAAFAAAHDFAVARGQIENINLDPTATAVDNLADAANNATAALLNVPSGYRTALARYLASVPVAVGAPPVPIGIAGPPSTPTPPPVGIPVAPPGSGGGGSGTGRRPEKPFTNGDDPMSGNYYFGDIKIDGSKFNPAQLFDQITQEGMRRARTVPTRAGSTLKWYDVPTLR